MGEAIKYLAPTASTLGLSMEGSAAAVMAFSDAGIQGSMAGRAFGTSLTRLASPAENMEAIMKDLEGSFFDAEGAMKPLHEIVEEREKGMSEYTRGQKTANRGTVLGTEG